MRKNEKGVKQLLDGCWKCDKVYKGVRISFKRRTKLELMRDLKVRIEKIEEEVANDVVQRKSEAIITFDKLFEIYGKSRQWIPYTFGKQRGKFLMYFEEFQDKLVKDVTNEEIIEWVQKIHNYKDEKRFQSDYANRILNIMKGMLIIAKEEGYCSRRINTTNIVLCKKPSSAMRTEKLESNYLTFSEFETLTRSIPLIDKINSGKISKEFLVFAITVLYYTGCRINEARAIQVKDIMKSFERRKAGSTPIYYISVTKQMEDNKDFLRKRLKTNADSGRRIYIMRHVYDYIIEFCEEMGYGKDDYIFDYYKNGFPITRKNLRSAILNILKKMHKMNLVDDSYPTRLTPHGFRNSNTLYLKELGVSIEMAAKMQGHNVSTMLDIYSRIDKNEIGEIFGG